MGFTKKVKKKIKKMLKMNAKTNQINKKVKLPYEEVGSNWTNNSEKPIAFMFGFNPWKREHMSNFFYEYKTAYVFGSATVNRLAEYFEKYSEKVFIVWGFKEPEGLVEYAELNGIKLIRVEDGFVRSVGLGAGHSLPLSIAADSRTLYFDSRSPSDLEVLLNNYDFTDKEDFLKKAKECMDLLIDMGVSKYNHTNKKDISSIYGEKTKKRILVVGQVEDDASIRYGCSKKMNNNDLVWAAYNENPDAEIIYKPHPDVLEGFREMYSNPMDVAHISKVVTEPLGLVDALETIDHVYTITSLSGFEALIRGIKVTCFGAPFYSGWGLTDDRQQTNRRNRILTVEQLFAVAYMVYPRYIDIKSGKSIDLEQAIKLLLEMIDDNLLINIENLITERKYIETKDLILTTLSQNKNEKITIKIKQQLLKVHNALGNYKDAINVAEELVSKYKLRNAMVINEKAKALFKLNRFSEAKILFNESLNIEQTKENLNDYVEFLWKIEGPTQETIGYLNKIIESQWKLNEEDILRYAALYNHAGLYSEAKKIISTKEKLIKSKKINIEKIPYLALSTAIEKEFSKLSNDESNSLNVNIYNKIVKDERSFQKLIINSKGDFCIIGNGEINNKGELIDNHKLVIRIENFSNNSLNPLDTGVKTNVFFKDVNSDLLYEDTNTLYDLKLVYLNDPKHVHQQKNTQDVYRYYFDRDISVQSYNFIYYKELIKKLDKVPTNWLLLLYSIYRIQGPISQESLIEFNFKLGENISKEEYEIFNEIIKK
ncbi:Capsule polysaccharide biosynthesis protein [Mycobacteroides abscessus subsp. abscessus]|nr:Capsule polysaccharide biosynthesis protein [Mycobacteroides abscessus subsp. abscessus]